MRLSVRSRCEENARRRLAAPAPRAVQEGSARYEERAEDEHRVALCAELMMRLMRADGVSHSKMLSQVLSRRARLSTKFAFGQRQAQRNCNLHTQ